MGIKELREKKLDLEEEIRYIEEELSEKEFELSDIIEKIEEFESKQTTLKDGGKNNG